MNEEQREIEPNQQPAPVLATVTKTGEAVEEASTTEAKSAKEKKESKNYGKEIALVIVGAIIGIVPTFFTTQMQGKMQLKQFILDRQINALKDYSTSYNQLGSGILADLQATIYKLKLVAINGSISDKELDELIISLSNKLGGVQNFVANLNAQRTMVYALFGDDPPPVNIPSTSESQAEDFQKRIVGVTTDREIIRALIDTTTTTENLIIDSMKKENLEIQKLAKRVQQQY